MSPSSKPVRNVILVAIDMSPEAKNVVASAAELARKTPGAELHVVHAVDPRAAVRQEANSSQPYDLIIATHSDFLDERAREARASSGVTVVGHLVEDPAPQAILQTAANIDADTIVVGTHGRRGLARWVMGSVAEAVVRGATCPVWVLREKHHETPQAEQIEPPCPDCVETQRASGGEKLWCARHAAKHPRMHLHYKNVEGFGAGSNLLRP